MHASICSFNKAKNSKSGLMRVVAFCLTENPPFVLGASREEALSCILSEYESQKWMEKQQVLSLCYLANPGAAENHQQFTRLVQAEVDSLLGYGDCVNQA